MSDAMQIRPLSRDEIEQIWSIDRSELTETIYRLESGALVPYSVYFDMRGWPPGEAEIYGPLLYACFDRGGAFTGAFDGPRLVGVAVLDTLWLGPERDLLQLKFLHVGHGYRDQGLGARLFARAQAQARERGARGLYISATPSEHTVRFYQRMGCVLAAQPDPELFALEPEDIHFTCPV